MRISSRSIMKTEFLPRKMRIILMVRATEIENMQP